MSLVQGQQIPNSGVQTESLSLLNSGLSRFTVPELNLPVLSRASGVLTLSGPWSPWALFKIPRVRPHPIGIQISGAAPAGVVFQNSPGVTAVLPRLKDLVTLAFSAYS